MSLEWYSIMPNKIQIEGLGRALSPEELEAITNHLLNKGEVKSVEEFDVMVAERDASREELLDVKALKDPLIKLRNRLDGEFDDDILFADYVSSATCKGGMNRSEFDKFINFINYLNSKLNGETKGIPMNGDFIMLKDIPFDSRLKCLLTPVSITYDIYDNEMTDFKIRRCDLSNSLTLEDWVTLQQKFFRNWRGKKADQSNSLADLIERVTISQIGKRSFHEDGSRTSSNYFIPSSGEIYQMPVKLPFTLWDANRDCLSYNQAVRRTYLGLYDRLADISK